MVRNATYRFHTSTDECIPKYSIFWYISNTTGYRMKLKGPVFYLVI